MVKSYAKINNIFMRGKIVFPNKVDGEKSASFIFCNFFFQISSMTGLLEVSIFIFALPAIC